MKVCLVVSRSRVEIVDTCSSASICGIAYWKEVVWSIVSTPDGKNLVRIPPTTMTAVSVYEVTLKC